MPDSTKPVAALHDHAADNLRFIRTAMERASTFTAVPGIGTTLVGITALVAARLGGPDSTTPRFLMVWLGEGMLAAILSAIFTIRKAARTNVSLVSATGRRFALAFLPPFAAGAVLTILFCKHGWTSQLPAMWLLLYGTAVMCGGALSVRIVPFMGATLMAIGVAAVFTPFLASSLFMGLGFGVVHVVFGLCITRFYGG